jgi:NTE family protein
LDDSTGKLKLGLALGSGASRGWSHVGVVKAFLEAGIEPDVIAGTSVGAMVGASYAAGNLEKLEQWVLGSTRTDVFSFFNFRLANSAFVDVQKLNWFLESFVAARDVRIEDLSKPFVAVCTDLDTGREVWLKEGVVADAIRASMAMPALFPPVRIGDQWLVDGGLNNPVPISACRALGADIVVGVNLNFDIINRNNHRKRTAPPENSTGVMGKVKKQAKEVSDALFPAAKDGASEHDKSPGWFYAISKSVNIFQDRITRSRLAGEPADVLISPRVGDIGLLDFQRAAEAIEEGEASARSAIDEVRRLLKN